MSVSSSSLLRTALPIGTPPRYPSSLRNPSLLPITSRRNIKSCFLGTGQGLQFLSTGLGDLTVSKTHLWGMVAGISVQPGPLVPSNPSPGSWNVWIAGILASIILPFLGFKWGPLMKLKSEVDTVVQIAEDVTETIERVAEKVEDVAEEVADHLPAGGKLKDAAMFIENLARETAKDAHLVDEVIDKVQEIEDKVESFFEPVAAVDQGNEMPTEANGQQK
ncbi:uncharacterized protein LOC122298645 [Carya illinoinensis]|uniref:Uncharacterized protein n=1 Tax=Carya illinoinensis TaxID=32201 RepID=A0A8T1N1Q9_CARIL|nr:uncharacterized protein LOC122298645 [Carya illinoinensis]KAG6624519.1 hypothetical protein CIPAW_16G032300 [Carya illinoinensis]